MSTRVDFVVVVRLVSIECDGCWLLFLTSFQISEMAPMIKCIRVKFPVVLLVAYFGYLDTNVGNVSFFMEVSAGLMKYRAISFDVSSIAVF